MTPAEIAAEKKLFESEIGSKAPRLFLSFDTFSKQPLSLSLYLDWPVGDPAFRIEANSFDEGFSLARAKWSEVADEQRRQTIRKMALSIIRLTAEQGHCTDAALRAEYSAIEVECYADEACARADEMASNGPFRVDRLAGANAA